MYRWDQSWELGIADLRANRHAARVALSKCLSRGDNAQENQQAVNWHERRVKARITEYHRAIRIRAS